MRLGREDERVNVEVGMLRDIVVVRYEVVVKDIFLFFVRRPEPWC